jgi:hypothetical protein
LAYSQTISFFFVWLAIRGGNEGQLDLFGFGDPVLRGVAAGQLDLRVPVRERNRLFPDDLFIGLFAVIGRRSVGATVMVLQRLEGLSDREAVDRFTFDARWRYAAGVGGWDGAGPARFARTALVDMRESGPFTDTAGLSVP